VDQLLNRAKGISAISYDVIHYYGSRTSLPIKLIRQALDWSTINKLTLENGTKAQQIIFVGRLIDKKGILQLVEGFEKFIRSVEAPIKLAIVGDGILSARIRQRIAEYDLKEHIRLYGAKGHEESLRMIRDSRLLVAPSVAGLEDEDGIPTSMIEAMALGTTCMATAVGGSAEIIEDERTGYLLETADPSHIADRLHAWYASEIEQFIMGNAEEKIRMEYTRRLEVSDL